MGWATLIDARQVIKVVNVRCIDGHKSITH